MTSTIIIIYDGQSKYWSFSRVNYMRLQNTTPEKTAEHVIEEKPKAEEKETHSEAKDVKLHDTS